MEQGNISLAVPTWNGRDAIDVLFDTRHTSPQLEARIYEALLYAHDGWPFWLRQRLAGNVSDEQYARLVRILRAVGRLEPPIVWYCRLVGEFADHANSSADADPWRTPARRILDSLEIAYGWQ